MSNEAAFRMVEEWKRKVATLPDNLIDEAGPVMAAELQAELQKTAGTGQTPDGAAWAPRKDTGAKALPKVNNHLRVIYLDKEIIAAVKFPYSLHHWGSAKGKVKRQIIPEGIKVWQGTITRELSKAFRKHFAK